MSYKCLDILRKNYFDILRIMFGFVIAIFIFQQVGSAALDCSKCHTTEPGRSSVKARDTIEISNNTCLKCHNSEYPPTPIGYNTHLVHIGTYSVKVDYLTRHPKIDGINCDKCHENTGDKCKNCHRIGIPHVPGDIGKNCKGCHGEVDKLFKHPSIELKIHNIFNLEGNNKTACTMCHNPDDMKTFKLTNGFVTSIQESYKLCFQCHNGYYKLWDSGSHYVNKIMPRDPSFLKIKELKDTWENNWRAKNTCVSCHNPHNPSELYQLPQLQETKEATNISNTILESKLAYIIGAIVSILLIVVILKNRDRLKRLISRLISEVRDSLSKISIPISVSVEKYDETGKIVDRRDVKIGEVKDARTEEIKDINKDIKIKTEEELIRQEGELIKRREKLLLTQENKFSPEKPKKRFLYRHKSDILFVSGIGIMFLLFYIIFGTFMPMAVIISESMSPHIEKGDIVFFTDISRIDDIRTYNNSGGYESFRNYGDVILYKPSGKDVTPIVHRAMYYVEKGESMWDGGPSTPYDGYITKGDNIVTNPKYDQQISISFQQPVKKEWIIGVAKFRIPYIGYIRLILPIN